MAQPVGQVIDQHVDADVGARGERMRERPRDAEGERVTGELGGRLRGEAEEAPRDHVEGDERGGENETPARHVAHQRAKPRDRAPAEGSGDDCVYYGYGAAA